MKVYTYDLNGSRFMSNFIPVGAESVITYDKENLIDVSAIHSSAIEDIWVAKLVIWFWDNPQTLEVVNID